MPHPAIDPFAHGMLDVGEGHSIYWEACGNPAGKPALYVHGGPGSGASRFVRTLFDPDRYRVVLFDQRGCGRSRPLAGEPDADLSTNTTDHLIADIEALRAHLRIDRWLLFAISWGSTLAQAYAQRHPAAVTEVVLAPATMTRTADVDWLCRGLGAFFPAAWERFRDGVPPGERDGDLVSSYARLLRHPDPAVSARAAGRWCDWEEAIASPDNDGQPSRRFADARFRLGHARIVTHYWSNAAWLGERELLDGASRLAAIPAFLIHGQLDLGGPVRTAWEITRAWPGSELAVVAGAGHWRGLEDTVVARLDALADR